MNTLVAIKLSTFRGLRNFTLIFLEIQVFLIFSKVPLWFLYHTRIHWRFMLFMIALLLVQAILSSTVKLSKKGGHSLRLLRRSFVSGIQKFPYLMPNSHQRESSDGNIVNLLVENPGLMVFNALAGNGGSFFAQLGKPKIFAKAKTACTSAEGAVLEGIKSGLTYSVTRAFFAIRWGEVLRLVKSSFKTIKGNDLAEVCLSLFIQHRLQEFLEPNDYASLGLCAGKLEGAVDNRQMLRMLVNGLVKLAGEEKEENTEAKNEGEEKT
jgi:hypothetical protein